MPQPARSPSNPFPGLRPFRADEEHLFFGRAGQVDAMVRGLAGSRFLAVLGTSGSGKSSLVNCGLRPALHRGLMAEAGTSWRITQFRPGRDPIGGLAEALSAPGALFPASEPGRLPVRQMVDDTLRMSKLGLVETVRLARLGERENLLVVADQFEELFRYRNAGASAGRSNHEEAVAFVNLLLEAASQRKYPIYVVLTMRSDFLGDCAQFPGLPEAINGGQYLVPRLTRGERRAGIAGPIAVGDAQISPLLLTRLVNDVGDNPDQLSILQHALNRTWSYWRHECRREGPLAVEHYEATGAMAGALDRHAEKAFAELRTERQQTICKKVFQSLTDMGTDARGIRRPTAFGLLCEIAGAEAEEVASVLARFRKPSRSFLMPPAEDPLLPETVIDISHESLMRLWGRLGQWAHEEAQSAQLYRRLSDTARRYSEGQAALWRDPDLQFALNWRERQQPTAAWAQLYGGGFENAMAFLGASEVERARLAEQQKDEQARELERTRNLAEARAKSARLMRYGAIAAVLIAIGGFALFAWAWGKWGEAETAKAEAAKLARIATAAQQSASVEAQQAREAGQAALQARDAAKAAEQKATDFAEKAGQLEVKAWESRAESLIAQLTPADSPADIPPLWQIFQADDSLAPRILTAAFTSEPTMRKVMQRGFSMRRALSGPGGRRLPAVAEALRKYCVPEPMANLYRTGVCVALGRLFYPADVRLVSRVEDAFQSNWLAWENGQRYAPSPVNAGKSFRDEVEASYGSMLEMLDAGAAAQFSAGLLDDLAKGPHVATALSRVSVRLAPKDAAAIARKAVLKAENAPRDRQVFLDAAPVLARVAGPAESAAVVDALLDALNKSSDRRPWLVTIRAALEAGNPAPSGIAAILNRLSAQDPAKLSADEQDLWRILVRGASLNSAPDAAARATLQILNRWPAAPMTRETRRARMADLQAAAAGIPSAEVRSVLQAGQQLMDWDSTIDPANQVPLAGAGSALTGSVITPQLELLSAEERLSTDSRNRIKAALAAVAGTGDTRLTPQSTGILVNALRLPSAAPGKTLPPEIAQMKSFVKTHLSDEMVRFPSTAKATVAKALQAGFPKAAEDTRGRTAEVHPAYQAAADVPTSDSLRSALREVEAKQIDVLIQRATRKAELAAIFRKQASPAPFKVLPPGDDKAPDVEDYNKVVRSVVPGDDSPLVNLKTGTRSQDESDRLALALARYIREHSRTLLESGSIGDGIALLTQFRPAPETVSTVVGELFATPEPDRSQALCWGSSSGIVAILDAWGSSADHQIVPQVIQWPSCQPGAFKGIADEAAALNNVAPVEVGVRGPLVLVEQFTAWARQHGYRFDQNVRHTIR